MMIDTATLGTLREKLETEKTRLEEELGRFAEATDIPGEYATRYENIGTDRDENASEVEEYSDNIALENNLEHQLKEVTDALKRIETNTYGQCEICHEPIDLERLQAYPAARICMRHA